MKMRYAFQTPSKLYLVSAPCPLYTQAFCGAGSLTVPDCVWLGDGQGCRVLVAVSACCATAHFCAAWSSVSWRLQVLDYMRGGELFFHLKQARRFTEDRQVVPDVPVHATTPGGAHTLCHPYHVSTTSPPCQPALLIPCLILRGLNLS